MNNPCPTNLDCVCDDNPFQNLSSEAPDQFRYVRQHWASRACRVIYESFISQADADMWAKRLAEICEYGTEVGNDPITVTVDCP